MGSGISQAFRSPNTTKSRREGGTASERGSDRKGFGKKNKSFKNAGPGGLLHAASFGDFRNPYSSTCSAMSTGTLNIPKVFSVKGGGPKSPLSFRKLSTGSQNNSTVHLGGRTFLDTPYILPVDLEEADRVDQEHYMLRFLFRKNYLADLHKDNLKRGLDVGCGSGVWMLEMAHEFPTCEWTGVDIIDLFPKSLFPSNCQFLLKNILQDFNFAPNYFSYIHQRLLVTGIPSHQYPELLSNYWTSLTSFGILEICETDYRFLRTGIYGERINFWLKQLSQSHFIQLSHIRKMPEMLESAGFIEITRQTYSFPLGGWSEGLEMFGATVVKNAVGMLHAIKSRIELELQIEEEKILEALEAWPRECEQMKTYLNVKVYLAKKPGGGGEDASSYKEVSSPLGRFSPTLSFPNKSKLSKKVIREEEDVSALDGSVGASIGGASIGVASLGAVTSGGSVGSASMRGGGGGG